MEDIDNFSKDKLICLRLPIDIKEELLHAIDKYYKVEVVDLTANN